MSEPPQPPPWQGSQPPDPTAPMPPVSGQPAPGMPAGGGYPAPQPAPSYGQPQSDPYAAPPPPSFGQQPDPYASQPPPFGQQSDPYAAPPPPSFGQQSDPYGSQPPPPPGFPGQPGFPPPPGAPVPGAVPPKKGNGGKIALIIGLVAVVLLCGCGGLVAWGVSKAGDKIEDVKDALPTSFPTPTWAPTGRPTGGSSTDDENFKKGDCVVNEGTNSNPKLKKVTCKSGAFEVVAEIPFTTDATRCDNQFLGAGKGKYDSTYTYDQTPGTLGDYVLCLKQR